MRPAERPATMSFLSRFRTAPVTQEIDAILAATAIATSGKIYTQNVKHYPMPDLRLVRGW